ncbi:MAG: carboxypeptidase M32 [Bdellovibrionales bacterium]
MEAYKNLEARYRQITNLSEVQSIVAWDEAVMMPKGGSATRNQQLAELANTIQALATAPEIGQWIEQCEAMNHQLNDWQKANLREMNRHYVQLSAIPPELNRELVVARMQCEQVWRELRAKNAWTEFKPHLQKVLDLTRETLTGLSHVFKTPIYDTALDMFSPGLTTQTVSDLFGQIGKELPALVEHVIEKQKKEPVIVPQGSFPMAAQKALGLDLMKAVGFSMDNGRLDESHHPFCGGTSQDVRITTRYAEDEFVSALMGVLHETGHAIYDQNLPREWHGQPVGNSCGMAVHESQSLLMEMQVVRSHQFIQFALPFIEKHLGPYVKNRESLTVENLHRLVTRVEKGFIRVDADELTYPAHVILRFEIERDLVEDKWSLAELPEVWDQKMQKLLGLSTKGNFKDGCMQDVHWPSGAFGYFPAYTFGAVIAAQLFSTIEKSHPGIRDEVAKGKFTTIQSWLREKIWSQGSKLNTLDLVKSASGELSATPFLQHLNRRYLGA